MLFLESFGSDFLAFPFKIRLATCWSAMLLCRLSPLGVGVGHHVCLIGWLLQDCSLLAGVKLPSF